MMMTPDVNVFLIDFPKRGNEMVVENEDGSYTILINARLSYVNQVKAYDHAIKHLTDNDFEQHDVQKIEAIAHQIEKPIKQVATKKPDSSLEERERILQQIREQRKKIASKLERITAKNEYLFKHRPDLYEEMISAQRDAQRLRRYYGED